MALTGSGSGGPRLELVVEITYYDIDAEIVDELCRLGVNCCSGLGGGGEPPSGSQSTGSVNPCDHTFVSHGDNGSGGPDVPCTIDPSTVPRWFIEQFIAMVAGLPPALALPFQPYIALASACLANPAITTDDQIRDCMNFTGSAGVPPNASYYSYFVTEWTLWLQNHEADAMALCLGLPLPGGNGAGNQLPPIDIERIELELDGDAIQESHKTCIVIDDENCDICNLASLTA